MAQGDFNRNKTHCPHGHEYTEENTYVNPNNGRRWCKTCMKANAKKQVIRKYGITEKQFEELLTSQDNKCAICREEFKSDHERHIDHDHGCCISPNRTCGRCVRGILCGECNRGIARFREDEKLLLAAASYLGKTN